MLKRLYIGSFVSKLVELIEIIQDCFAIFVDCFGYKQFSLIVSDRQCHMMQ